MCTETTEVVNNEVNNEIWNWIEFSFDIQVCATYYDQHKVTAEIKTVRAVFEKSCKDEQVNISTYIFPIQMISLSRFVSLQPPPTPLPAPATPPPPSVTTDTSATRFPL